MWKHPYAVTLVVETVVVDDMVDSVLTDVPVVVVTGFHHIRVNLPVGVLAEVSNPPKTSIDSKLSHTVCPSVS